MNNSHALIPILGPNPMSRINVLVAATPSDLEADGIAAAVAGYANMTLVDGRPLPLDDVEARLTLVPAGEPCALVLVGNNPQAKQLAKRLLAARIDLVVLRVDIVDHLVQIAQYASCDKSLELHSLLAALCFLVADAGDVAGDRMRRLTGVNATPGADARPLLDRAVDWVHAVLRHSAMQRSGGNGDIPGLTLTAATFSDLLEALPRAAAPTPAKEVRLAEQALADALLGADTRGEPLAATAMALDLNLLEFRLLLLAMAPELDLRYQRCIGLLLDDLGRRVGSLALFMALLGDPATVRRQLALSGNLARWRVLENRLAGLPAADEALRVDGPLLAWMLGEPDALDHDPAVRRLLRLAAWPGASLFAQAADRDFALGAIKQLLAFGDASSSAADAARFVLYSGDCTAWAALLEVGAGAAGVAPVRVDTGRLAGWDPAAIEESGARLARLARLTRRPLLLDTCAAEVTPAADDALRLLLAAVGAAGVRAGLICTEPTRIVRLIGPDSFTLADEQAVRATTRLANVRAAAGLLGLQADDAALQMVARQYPLEVDGFEHAMRLARAREKNNSSAGDGMAHFIGACQHVAAEGVSRMAECIEPSRELGQVILPPDRARQLDEIVDSVRLAGQVLDVWRFGEQLPFGRGVTALFHGASGTGKTMAAIGIAQRLNIRVLRIDLSRVVSKYIGETEKNIDRIFLDASRSGAAILIDEAEALLGKRSEVKDAHDRYANIEVAYLLQRMETYEGLAILTTNLRQNLDPAFLRRLRFVIDFPRPDADAREKIWRRCLPSGSHELSEAAFRHLARKVDLTGGNIRQITLRAAFLAAAAGSRIALPHIAHAASAELTKLGMAAIDLDLPGDRLAA
jgi:hypothetical protein